MSFNCLNITIFLFLAIWRLNSVAADNDSYNDVAFCDHNFIAVGMGGRIDIIDESGEITELPNIGFENLNTVIYTEGTTVVAGDSGTILISENLFDFKTVKSGITENIHSLSDFKNLFIAGAENGKILISNNLHDWQIQELPLRGNVISLSSDDKKCFGITDLGEIISTTDGVNWKVIDYNAQNKGFVKTCIFTSILVADNQIIIVGKHDDDTPFALFSNLGNVWIERSLNYEGDDGNSHLFAGIPNDVAFNSHDRQFFIACNNGDVSILSDCSKCNEAVHLTQKNLKAVAFGNNGIAFVGESGFIRIEQ